MLILFSRMINEIDQSFALVGVLGDDVPDRFACFREKLMIHCALEELVELLLKLRIMMVRFVISIFLDC